MASCQGPKNKRSDAILHRQLLRYTPSAALSAPVLTYYSIQHPLKAPLVAIFALRTEVLRSSFYPMRSCVLHGMLRL